MKDLPIGIQTFEDLITGNFVYVDKTRYLYPLVTPTKGVYFLSRPRRFGKSMTISTLDAIFKGKKDLFKDLWIYDQPFEWKEHPIIRIDFSMGRFKDPEELENYICVRLKEIGKNYGVELENKQYTSKFSELIQKLSLQNKVVVLIDEYDKPILDHITDMEKAAGNREVLKGFYSVIKSSDEYLRFVFLTGVSKFSKVGVFSGLNNLEDLTMTDMASALVGYTEDEIPRYFGDHLTALEEKLNLSADALRAKIRHWYNGYRFSDNDARVYNPFSCLHLLKHHKFLNYWFESGTATFLLKLIEKYRYDLNVIEEETVGLSAFSSYEIDQLKVLPLLFQTGYLTIKDYIPERNLYRLGYPNYEVENSFLDVLVETYSKIESEKVEGYLYGLTDALDAQDLELFFQKLRVFFANVPYDIQLKDEKYYQTIFYLILKMMGLRVETEVRTNQGRIDAVIEMKDRVYIFEFKLFGTKEEALAQIKTMKYYEKYASPMTASQTPLPFGHLPLSGEKRQVVLVGVEFNPAERNIGEWVVESL